MFAWETLGKKTFKDSLKPELFTPTKGLAANQGLYNGFLAAGLIWSLLIGDENWAKRGSILNHFSDIPPVFHIILSPRKKHLDL